MNNEYSYLQKSILKTIAYFDIFSYPLTLFEIHKWLYRPNGQYSISQIRQVLGGEELKSVLAEKFGFYYLAGREEIIRTRLDRYQLAEKKFRIALRIARSLRWLAFVKMIAICNNAGYNNALAQSDIDFFIIIGRGRLWWSRLLITLLVSLLGVRRHGKKIADRICLSFYVADDNLDLSGIAIKPDDIYLVYWLATLAPIYHDGSDLNLSAHNLWLKDYLPNYFPADPANRRRVADNRLTRFSKRLDMGILATAAGDRLEKVSKIFQQKKMHQRHPDAHQGTEVVINDSMLKFHENDMRLKYAAAWQKRLNDLNITT
jgi:hypothetical protein